MSMSIRAALLVPLLLFVPVLSAQRQENVVEPKVARETTSDSAGLAQWVKLEPKNCPRCRGTKVIKCLHCDGLERAKNCLECKWKRKSPCRDCGGTGRVLDPLLAVRCPGCYGAGVFPCLLCHNEGSFPIVGGGRKPAKCSGCKTLGGIPCVVCSGKRIVSGPALKPSVAEASLKDLRGAKAKILAASAKLRRFRSQNNTTKDLRAYRAALAPAARYLPALKKCQKMITAILKGLKKGDGFVGNDQVKAAGFKRFRELNQAYLKHQVLLIDLCIERMEANAKIDVKK